MEDTSIRDFFAGNWPVSESLNLKKEIHRFRQNPLEPLIGKLNERDPFRGSTDINRYDFAFYNYSLSVERFLRHISIGRKFQKEVRHYYGGQRKFTERQKNIAKRYRENRPFFELDFSNCLIHARILMDRVIALSRRFLMASKLPSFSSFNSHKKFLLCPPDELVINYPEYVEYISKYTGWFDESLKVIRDKFVVHNAPKHLTSLGYPMEDGERYHDLVVHFHLYSDKEGSFEGKTIVSISIRRLARDIESFLAWYNDYAIQAIDK